MIRKHVDLIAIGLLLGGIAVYTHVRSLMLFEFDPGRRMGFTNYHRSTVVIPDIPPLPYTRD